MQALFLQTTFCGDECHKFITILLTIVGVAFLIYCIASIFLIKQVVISKKQSGSDKPIPADQYYYLPTALLTIQGKETIAVVKSAADETIRSATLVDLQIHNPPPVLPAPQDLLLVSYKGFAFANDEIRVSTDINGMLENISAITEDRITNIIQDITDAPKKIIKGQDFAPVSELAEKSPGEPTTTEIHQYSRSFVFLPDDLISAGFSKPWTIVIEGKSTNGSNVVDASIQLKQKAAVNRLELDDIEYKGFLTRPLVTRRFGVYTGKVGNGFNSQERFAFIVQIPDVSRIISVPIIRFAFVKGQSQPKFSSGLLIENYINKPSQVEGFLSIPINVLKAIFSIPAQLFNFKITHFELENNLETEKRKLASVTAAGNKQPAGPTAANPATAPLSKQDQQLVDSARAIINERARQLTKLPGLGKAPAIKLAKEPLKISSYIDLEKYLLTPDSGVLPTPPEPSKWKVNIIDWNAYRNDNSDTALQDCVAAAAAHQIMFWSGVALNKVKVPLENDVILAYKSVPADDKGRISIHDFLAAWRSPGIAHDKIDVCFPIREKNYEELKLAVYLFGACMVGLQLPIAVQSLEGVWDVEEDDPVGDWKIGSWDGHAVAVIGYDNEIITFITWGREQKMTR